MLVRQWLCAVVACLVMVMPAAASPVLPETPRFRHFGVADGLPSRVVYAMVQDHEGYLWFATGDGLARFDGLDWDVFRHDPADPDSIPGNGVIALAVDSSNRLWLGLEGQGLARLSADRRRFEHLRGDHEEAFAGPYVWALRETPDGAMWVGTFQEGLYRRDADGGVRHFMPDPERDDALPSDVVLSLDVDHQGRLWVATSRGAAWWDGERFHTVEMADEDPPLVVSLGIDDAGQLWFGQRDRYLRRRQDGSIERQVVDAVVHGVLDVDDGLVWLATGRGLMALNAEGIREDAYGHPALARASLQQAMIDREGSLWLVGMGGAWQLASGWQRFASFQPGPAEAEGLSSDLVRGMAPDGRGGVWLAGHNGLDHLDLASGRIRRGTEYFPHAGTGLWALAPANEGRLWVGRSGGLLLVDPAGGEPRSWIREDGGEGSDVLAGPVDLLHVDARGWLWVGNHGGGIQVRNEAGDVVHALRPGDGQGLEWPDPEQIADGPDGEVWIADAGGLLRWNTAGQRLERVPGGPEDRVYTFAWRDPETLWLHRFTALERYRYDGRTLHLEEVVDAGQGLAAVESGGLLIDDAGALWLSTSRGLLHRSPEGVLRMFGLRDGLPAQDFYTRPMLQLDNGVGVASTQGGLVLFDPGFNEPREASLPVQVKGLVVRRDDQEHALDPMAPLVLGPGDRDLRVSVRLLSFVDPAGHRYRMRLSQHDADWVSLGSLGERTLTRLQPGEYRLDIQASDASGRWSPVRTLEIRALPPWWQTGWAWLAYFILALLLASWGATIFRLRMARRHALELAEQQRCMAEQASQAKTEFLATLGHEVRTPMTGVLGMSELLLQSDLTQKQRGQVGAIHLAGRHLLRLVNDALDLARIEAGKLVLESQPFRVRVLVNEVADLLRPLAAKKGLSFECEFSADLPEAVQGDQYRVRQILLNLGSNAIKFTEHGGVSIRVSRRGDWLDLAVRDSGPGLNAEQRERLFQRFEQAHAVGTRARQGGSGLGLAISQELAAAMGGRISLDSSPGEGSCFEVSLPLDVVPVDLLCDAPATSLVQAQPSAALDVLLVEDDAIVAEVIEGLLQAQGHRVVHAPHGLAALSQLARRPFDLAFLDLDLPGLHGVELARLIRKQGHGLALLAITARADADAEPAAIAAGMNGFLRKPLTADALAAAIARSRPAAAVPAESDR